ncbi:unnamed protein product [Ectocarpus sp. CCAP 1310/34]|nr:unnamed protein product [Ectocarpus sp. CCAP 1310/34]
MPPAARPPFSLFPRNSPHPQGCKLNRRDIARILKQNPEDRDLDALAVLLKEAHSKGYTGKKVDDGRDALAWGSNPVEAVFQQQSALLEDTKCAKVAEACPHGSTSLLVKRKWFDPRGGCAITSCVHLENGDGGGGRAQDTASTVAEADGRDEENTRAPEASAKGNDVAMKAIAEKLAELSQQHPVGSVKKALATMRQQQAKASARQGTSKSEFCAPSSYVPLRRVRVFQ